MASTSEISSRRRLLLEAAQQLREDSKDCWGIRRKLNLRNAANIMERAYLDIGVLLHGEQEEDAPLDVQRVVETSAQEESTVRWYNRIRMSLLRLVQDSHPKKKA